MACSGSELVLVLNRTRIAAVHHQDTGGCRDAVSGHGVPGHSVHVHKEDGDPALRIHDQRITVFFDDLGCVSKTKGGISL